MIKFKFTEKDYKKYLKSKRRNTNIIFIILGTLLYFYITFYLIFYSPFEAFIFYGLYISIFIVVIILFDELYCLINVRNNKKNNIFGNYKVDIQTDKVIVNIGDNSNIYLNTDIKKVKIKKKYTIIKYNNRTSLLFMQNYFKDEDDYDKNMKKLLK